MSEFVHIRQIGFDALLAEADAENRERKFERKTVHLPETMEAGITYFRGLIAKNHAAMLAADEAETRRLRKEARLLAVKLNRGDGGILAHETAPGYVLARETAAKPGTVPLWGQTGEFAVQVAGMAVRIEMDGMFGIGATTMHWPGFSASALKPDKPFLSETGYRSFLGVRADPAPDMTPDTFAEMIVEAYVERDLRGKLLTIAEKHRRPSTPESSPAR